jgi:2OG-Fe(II) oxygenase superfamily
LHDESSNGDSASPESVTDCVVIRDRRLPLDGIVNSRLHDAEWLAHLHGQVRKAEPFEHLVVDDFFHPTLLELVREEFDLVTRSSWQVMRSTHEKTHRSKPRAKLGPASELYFGIVNSGWFLDALSAITGVDDLLADPRLFNGGLHETRDGGVFGIHRDFDRHVRYGLHNEMVLITYLNQEWDPSWGGALELWDSDSSKCIKSIPPRLGRTVLLRHGPASFHGHTIPWQAPLGKVRRSVATYYYSNRFARDDRQKRKPTEYLFPDVFDAIRFGAQRILPPVVWEALRNLSRG